MSAGEDESLQAFVAGLRDLRAQVGNPPLRELHRLNPSRLPSSTLHDLLKGARRRPPSWTLVDAFVRACLEYGRQHGVEVTRDEAAYVREWLERHGALSVARGEAHGPEDAEDSRPQILGGTPPVRGHFSGRSALMAQLATEMGAQTDWPVCLIGPGGHGKTQLAAEYIHKHASRYATIWWIRAEEAALIRTDMAALGRRLDHGGHDADSVPETLKLLCEDADNVPWLLVYDNAGHPDTLRRFLPPAMHGHVLITSRDRAWYEVAVPVDVGVFTREDSVELLIRRVPGISPEEAAEVAEEIGDLPLGIVQAGSYMRSSGLPAGEYVARLREQPGRMLDQHPPAADYGAGLASVWNLTFETLGQNHPEALHLLQRCAFMRPESIARGLLRQGSLPLWGESSAVFGDPMLVDNAIAALTSYGLLRMARGGTLQLHRLLQSMVRERLAETERVRVKHDVHRLLAGAECGEPENRADLQRYAELAGHAEASDLASCDDPDVRSFRAKLTRYFGLISDADSAERYAGVALDVTVRPAGAAVPDRVQASAAAPAVRRSSALAREMEEDDWTRLIYQLATGDCTPIVGADVSPRKAARIRALSWELADRLDYPYTDAWNFESVLDYAVTLPEREGAEEAMAALRHEWEQPDEEDDTYVFLAEIPATSYVTTAYHDQLKRALLQAGRDPIVKVPPWRPELSRSDPVVAPTPERPLVCHLIGAYEMPGSLVLSESDRTRFMRADSRSWSPDIIEALVTYPFLMLGCNPRSSSYGLLMSFLSGMRTPRRNTVALHDPEPGGMGAAAKKYQLSRIRRLNMRASVYWGDAHAFITELSHRRETSA